MNGDILLSGVAACQPKSASSATNVFIRAKTAPSLACGISTPNGDSLPMTVRVALLLPRRKYEGPMLVRKASYSMPLSGPAGGCRSHRNIYRVLETNFDPPGWVTTVKRGRWRCASPDPPDLIEVDDFVHGDDSQAKAFGLANQHAIEGIAMMLWEFLEEAAIVDGG
jgi:hypothetical protein